MATDVTILCRVCKREVGQITVWLEPVRVSAICEKCEGHEAIQAIWQEVLRADGGWPGKMGTSPCEVKGGVDEGTTKVKFELPRTDFPISEAMLREAMEGRDRTRAQIHEMAAADVKSWGFHLDLLRREIGDRNAEVQKRLGNLERRVSRLEDARSGGVHEFARATPRIVFGEAYILVDEVPKGAPPHEWVDPAGPNIPPTCRKCGTMRVGSYLTTCRGFKVTGHRWPNGVNPNCILCGAVVGSEAGMKTCPGFKVNRIPECEATLKRKHRWCTDPVHLGPVECSVCHQDLLYRTDECPGPPKHKWRHPTAEKPGLGYTCSVCGVNWTLQNDQDNCPGPSNEVKT